MNPFRETFEQQHAYFQTHLKTSTAAQRITKLKKMRKWILAHQHDIQDAVFNDFSKPKHEVDLTEILPVSLEIRHAVAHLRDWMRTRKVGTPLAMLGSSTEVRCEPKGVCLIIAPWNFPFMLAVAPIVSAVAAGCAVVLKPSEFTPATSAVIDKMANELFHPGELTVIQGAEEVAKNLTALPFDHIFFTGSPQVGKLVMKAAAINLSSVTLELGGRNPVIIDESADLKDAARKLVWGKFFNAGQSCMAPNYVLIHDKVHDRFLSIFEEKFKNSFPEHYANMINSPDFARVINRQHHDRIAKLVDETVAAGAELHIRSGRDAESNFLSPKVLVNVKPEHPIMQDEIFGPVLPILRFREISEAISIIQKIEKPLGLYIFSRKRNNINRVITETSSGNVMVNETTIIFAHPEVPFGGVNHSGLGKAHGYNGFLEFSNQKPVMYQNRFLPTTLLAFAPYTKLKNKLLNLVIRYF